MELLDYIAKLAFLKSSMNFQKICENIDANTVTNYLFDRFILQSITKPVVSCM